jgi:CelD/BcsL family acetyltransferase involved in cellulose biosynthesis
MQRKCEALGGAELRVERAIDPGDVESLLRRGFQVEHSSWKGQEDSSVLSTAAIFGFYMAQARCLAARGQLQLSFLELGGKPVAFEYGWLSKGVYFAMKVGYDQTRADVTPGQVLRWLLFEKLHDEGCWSAIDFLSPITRASSSWVNDRYTISRLVVAPREWRGRASDSAAQDETPADLAPTEMALAEAQSAFSEDRSRGN